MANYQEKIPLRKECSPKSLSLYKNGVAKPFLNLCLLLKKKTDEKYFKCLLLKK